MCVIAISDQRICERRKRSAIFYHVVAKAALLKGIGISMTAEKALSLLKKNPGGIPVFSAVEWRLIVLNGRYVSKSILYLA